MLNRISLTFALLAALSSGPLQAGSHTIRGHGGSHSHGGYHGGGYYGGHYGGYYGGHHGYYSSYYAPFYFPFGYSYAAYYPVYPAYYGYGGGYGSPYIDAAAYLDTDVTPEEAAVYLDGQYVGIADDFDGWPNYLPVEPGRHTLTFKADGYRSVTRQINLPRGASLDLDFTMSKGEGTEPAPPAGLRSGDVQIAPSDRDADTATPGVDEDQMEQPEAGPGFVRLRITPSDASVYLDGEFFATAAQLVGLHGDLRLESGTHRIEVVKPGFKEFAKELLVPPGGRQTVSIVLEKEGPR